MGTSFEVECVGMFFNSSYDRILATAYSSSSLVKKARSIGSLLAGWLAYLEIWIRSWIRSVLSVRAIADKATLFSVIVPVLSVY